MLNLSIEFLRWLKVYDLKLYSLALAGRWDFISSEVIECYIHSTLIHEEEVY